MSDHPEGLRNIQDIHKPDPRNLQWVLVNQETGEQTQITLEDWHQNVAVLQLEPPVPLSVIEQFDVARNLYLHAWNYYRFLPVAESKAYTCLELALKERLGYKGKHIGLAALLKKAQNKSIIRNDKLECLEELVHQKAKRRYEQEKLSSFIKKQKHQKPLIPR